MAHPNEDALRKMDEAQSSGDIETMLSFVTDDVVVHIGGRSKLAGDFKGRDALKDQFGRFMQVMGENAEFETHDIVAGDKHGFILQTLKGDRAGDRIEAQSVGIFHFANGKVNEAWFIDVDPYSADPWYDKGAK